MVYVQLSPILNSTSILLLFLFVYQLQALLDYAHNISTAHTDYVTGIMMSQDSKYFVSASLDTTIKFWNTTNFSLMHIVNYASPVRAMSIDYFSNNVYACFQNSDISVLDPITYSELDASGTGAYPSSGYGNSIKLKSDGSQFYMGGYSGSMGTKPKVFTFSSSTYGDLGSTITSNYDNNASINSMAIINDTYIVISSSQTTTFQIYVWEIATTTLITTLTDCTAKVTSVHYNYGRDWIFATSLDQTIRVFALSSVTGQYHLIYNLDTSSIGNPYGVSSQINGYLYVIIGSNLIQYTFNADGSFTTGCQTNKWRLTGIGNSISISPSRQYVLIGCQNGDINVFEIFNISNNKVQELIIILVSVLSFIVLIVVIIDCVRCRNSQRQQNQEKKKHKSIQITQNDINPVVY